MILFPAYDIPVRGKTQRRNPELRDSQALPSFTRGGQPERAQPGLGQRAEAPCCGSPKQAWSGGLPRRSGGWEGGGCVPKGEEGQRRGKAENSGDPPLPSPPPGRAVPLGRAGRRPAAAAYRGSRSGRAARAPGGCGGGGRRGGRRWGSAARTPRTCAPPPARGRGCGPAGCRRW